MKCRLCDGAIYWHFTLIISSIETAQRARRRKKKIFTMEQSRFKIAKTGKHRVGPPLILIDLQVQIPPLPLPPPPLSSSSSLGQLDSNSNVPPPFESIAKASN